MLRLGVEFLGEEDRDIEVWRYMKSVSPFEAKDMRCCFAIFLSSVAKPQECLQSWCQDRFHRSHLAFECDHLRGKKFQAHVTVASMANTDLHAQTSAKVLDIVDRSVRDSRANTVSVSVMMLSRDENRRICNIIIASASELKHWDGHANKVLRSMEESVAWAVDQTSGGFHRHLNSMVKALHDPAVMQRCGFFKSGAGRGELPAPVMYQVEKEFAELHGHSTLILMGLREKRTLWLSNGWPHSMLSVNKSPAWAHLTLKRCARSSEP